MRWFYFWALLQIFPSFTPGQNCQIVDLICEKDKWDGVVTSFDFQKDEIRLDASSEGHSKMTFYPEISTQSLFLRFTLDFPPSLTNQFQLHVFLSHPEHSEKKISFIIGETGNDDGVMIQLTKKNKLVSEQKIWHGKYGEGAYRCEWVLSVVNDGIVLSDPVTGESEFIGFEMENESDLYFEKIVLECFYTKTRRDRFFFHSIELWSKNSFKEHPVERGDLFITEVMAGSSGFSPYVELYSSLDEPVCVSGLVLKVEDSYIDLPFWEFQPFSYYPITAQPIEEVTSIIRDALASTLFTENKKSLSLELIHHGRIIHQVKINIDTEVMNHSHEMIDIIYPCRADNWTYSLQQGGSPGMENTVFGGLGPPEVDMTWIEPGEIRIAFPYLGVDSVDLIKLIHVNSDMDMEANSSGEVFVRIIEDHEFSEMEVHIRGELYYCGPGVDQWDTTLTMTIPVPASPYDVVISEVMYDPPHDCPEYVEIAVLSESPVWMGDLVLQREGGQYFALDLPLQPVEFSVYVLTRDRTSFETCYPEAYSSQILERNLFNLPNSGTMLRLVDGGSDLVLDEIDYDPSWHHVGYRNQKGIVLERDYLSPSSKRWLSGWPHFQYRSPGFLPSEWKLNKGNKIEFSTHTIRPGSGNEDEWLEILWRGEERKENGFMTIDIDDIGGNKVEQMLSSFPVQGGEIFRWNGKNSQQQLLKEGIYLFWIYYFNNIGNDQIFKKKCVLLHP